MKAPFADWIKQYYAHTLANWCDECYGSGIIRKLDLFGVHSPNRKITEEPCPKCQSIPHPQN